MSLDDFRAGVADPAIEFRPELRWWLAEGLHTDETLRREIADAHRLGFGGMEFLAMDEQGIDHARYGWGSEEWVHDSQVVVEETTRRGMSVSFTSGTNWSNANLPTITPDDRAAAQELDVAVEHLAAGERRAGPLPRIDLDAPPQQTIIPGHRGTVTAQHLVAVVAARVVDDEAGVLDAGSVVDLTAQVDGESLDWTAPDGEWRLFSYWLHGTGQTAEPSASVNYTVNYLDRDGVEAVIAYWDQVVLTPELRAQIAANPRAQMYMDSLELSTFGAGGLFFGWTLIEEFRARRGYDLAPWLPFLTRTAAFMAVSTVYYHQPEPADQLTVDKVRHDYVRTLTDLYIENMLRPFAQFLHSVGLTLRAEISYGLPFELTRPGPEVDGIETESLEFGSQIDAYRLLAGPAHLFGKQYSSETGATTRNHMLDHRFYDQIIATQLAAGITKTVLHGWASPAGAEGTTAWPGHEGMWPMFSERFDTRQPGSELYPLWNAAIGRLQYALRRGKPRIDVGILRTDHFTDNLIGMNLHRPDGARIPDETVYATAGMRNRENQWWQDLSMQDAGLTYEFLDGSLLLRDDVTFDDGSALVQPDGPGYGALVVYQSELDPDVAAHLLAWADRGLRLVIVNGARELEFLMAGRHRVHERAAVRTPGLDGRDDELAATMAALRQRPGVAEIDSPAQIVAALDSLGVSGRARFVTDDRQVLMHLREDGDLLVLYAYHYLYETGTPTSVRIRLPGQGAAHRLDVWSGELRPHAGVVLDGASTVVEIALAPGEVAVVVLDRSARPVATPTSTREMVTELTGWSCAVESWDAGAMEVITEDRGLGYETREVRPTTAVTRLEVGPTELRPWAELDGVGPEVSGVAEYRTRVELGALETGSRYLLDLGSTAGGLGSVRVGDGRVRGFDTSRPVVDVTADLREGATDVVVRVASSLNNRLLARGYYDRVPDVAAMAEGVERMQAAVVREHGLLGPVRLVREG